MKTITYFLLPVLLFLFNDYSFSQIWELQTSGTTQQLKGIYMIDETNGWICGDAGTLLKTNDGGQTWTQVTVTGVDLSSVIFLDSQTGIAVGDAGIIIRTTDGGASWNFINSGTTSQLRGVSKGSGNLVFAAGRDGAVVVSTDGGATWLPKNSGTTARFRGAAAAGINKLYAVGEDGIIKHSPDGGQTWITQTGGVNQDLHDVQFINENVGFAGGSGSNFIYTNNGGQTWILRNSGIFFGLNGIFFLDENRGWAVADIGTVFITTDAGITWVSQPCGSASTLQEVYFIHPGKGWSVGDNGTILMYTDNNIPVELNSFTASVSGNDVTLFWSTASETNNMGFEVERKVLNPQSSAGNWEKIGFVEGRGTAAERQDYLFADNDLTAGTYQYRLKQIDYDGTFEYFELSSEPEIELAGDYSLEQNYPNPFNPSTSISFNLPQDGFVNLKIYNILGNEVAVLINNELLAGRHNYVFDASGLSSGVYFYRLEMNNKFFETKQMILLK
jgi:photosystem II stability/assembly factor-like uncharacterized protein